MLNNLNLLLGYFSLKLQHQQIMCLGYITVHYNIEVEANSVFFLILTIIMNPHCNDSPSKLVTFLFVPGRRFKQQKHVCALSSGYPSLKWDRPHIPLSLKKKKGFDYYTAKQSQQW